MIRPRRFEHVIEHEICEGLLCRIACNFDSDGYAEETAVLAVLLPDATWHTLPQPLPIDDESADYALEESRRETLADWAAEDAFDAEQSRHDLDDWKSPF